MVKPQDPMGCGWFYQGINGLADGASTIRTFVFASIFSMPISGGGSKGIGTLLSYRFAWTHLGALVMNILLNGWTLYRPPYPWNTECGG